MWREDFAVYGVEKAYSSLPVALDISPKRIGQLGIALAAADGALDEIDAAPQIGQPSGARDAVEGGRRLMYRDLIQ